jgi:hypothetical protein
MVVYTFEEFMERLNRLNVKDTSRWSILLWKLKRREWEYDEGRPFNSDDPDEPLNKYKNMYYC